jgi:hypothetical protein
MHSMYVVRKDRNLWQGDIVDREKLFATNALRGHQDYIELRHDFVGFCVVSQTCDLVRDPERRAPIDFICLAVIRKLVDVFSANTPKDKIKQLLERIINHRENKEGYFYLHAEPSAVAEDGAVVDLRTTFSLHQKHYDQIFAARKLSLNDVFANKLGWMAGHLYSRIPNLEWNDLKAEEEESAEDFVARMLVLIKKEGRGKLPHEEPKWPTLDVFIDDPKKIATLDEESIRTLRVKAEEVLELLRKRAQGV